MSDKCSHEVLLTEHCEPCWASDENQEIQRHHLARLREALSKAEKERDAWREDARLNAVNRSYWLERAEKAESELSSMRAVVEAAKKWNPTVRGAGPHLIPEAQALVDALAALGSSGAATKECEKCHGTGEVDDHENMAWIPCPKCNPPAAKKDAERCHLCGVEVGTQHRSYCPSLYAPPAKPASQEDGE